MFGGHNSPPNIIQMPVVAFTNDRVDGPDGFATWLLQTPADQRIGGCKSTQRVCQHDRRFDDAEFFNLRRADELAETVCHVNSGWRLQQKHISLVRLDCRDASADRITFNNRSMPDLHASNIGERI